METDVRRDSWTRLGRGKEEWEGDMERVTWKHTLPYVKDSQWEFAVCVTQGTQTRAQ